MITDELRVKFEATFPHLDFSADKYGNYYSQRTLDHLYGYQAAHASRDAEVEKLKGEMERYRSAIQRHKDNFPDEPLTGEAELWSELDAAMREGK